MISSWKLRNRQMSRANRNPSLNKGPFWCAKTTLIWMHASLFALFMPFSVSAPNVNRDYISLWNIPQGSRKHVSRFPDSRFPGHKQKTEKMWSNFSFVLVIFKPKTVLMANYAWLSQREKQHSFQELLPLRAFFRPLDRKLTSKEPFFSGVKYKDGHIGHIFFLFSRISPKHVSKQHTEEIK